MFVLPVVLSADTSGMKSLYESNEVSAPTPQIMKSSRASSMLAAVQIMQLTDLESG